MFVIRAYTISENYRETGVQTVLGGVHPYMNPEECSRHCGVFIEEAENIWQTLLEDAENRQLKKIYDTKDFADLKLSPLKSRKGLKGELYIALKQVKVNWVCQASINISSYRKVARSVYSFDTIYKKLDHYWEKYFWHYANKVNPLVFKYRLLFALRMFQFGPNQKRFLSDDNSRYLKHG